MGQQCKAWFICQLLWTRIFACSAWGLRKRRGWCKDKSSLEFGCAPCQCTMLEEKQLLMLKATELRRRQGARLALSDKKTQIANPGYFTDPISGVRCRMTLKMSLWWVLHIQDPKPECHRWSKSFWQRFRMPYHSFIKILEMTHEDDKNDISIVRRWKSVTHTRRRS